MSALPKMTPVTSTNIKAVGHDGTDLYVSFQNGKTYRYPGAEAAYHKAMVEAPSPGSYFHKHVRGLKAEAV